MNEYAQKAISEILTQAKCGEIQTPSAFLFQETKHRMTILNPPIILMNYAMRDNFEDFLFAYGEKEEKAFASFVVYTIKNMGTDVSTVLGRFHYREKGLLKRVTILETSVDKINPPEYLWFDDKP